jgi:hypothetical protein
MRGGGRDVETDSGGEAESTMRRRRSVGDAGERP